MRKNKIALTDEQKTQLNYIIQHLLDKGIKCTCAEEPRQTAFYLSNKKGESLFYNILESGSIYLWAQNHYSDRPMFYTVRGVHTAFEDPLGIIEVAKELGVLDDWDKTQ